MYGLRCEILSHNEAYIRCKRCGYLQRRRSTTRAYDTTGRQKCCRSVLSEEGAAFSCRSSVFCRHTIPPLALQGACGKLKWFLRIERRAACHADPEQRRRVRISGGIVQALGNSSMRTDECIPAVIISQMKTRASRHPERCCTPFLFIHIYAENGMIYP